MRVGSLAGEAEGLQEMGNLKTALFGVDSSASGDICDALMKCKDLFGMKGVTEVLKSLPSSVSVYQEFSTSPSLATVLDSCLNSDETASLILQILHKAEDSQVGGLDHRCIPLISSFACDNIGAQSLALSEASASLMESLIVKSGDDTRITILESFMASLNKVKSDTTLLLRYCTVLSKILNRGDNLFTACLNCGGITQILDLCRCNDVLLQVTALDLLYGFAGSRNGIQYLIQNGVLEWLVDVASGSNGSEPDPFLGPSALECLSNIFTRGISSKVIQDLTETPELPRFINAVFQNIDSPEQTSRFVGLFAIAEFASSSEKAMEMMFSNDDLMSTWVSLLNSPKTELKASVLHSIARVIDSNIQSSPEAESKAEQTVLDAAISSSNSIPLADSEQVKLRKLSLLSMVGRVKKTSPLTFLLLCVKQPISEVRHAAYETLAALARRPTGWGLQILFEDPTSGFKEFLEDYGSEFSKEGKEWKFSVVAAIAENTMISHVREDVEQFIRKRVLQGPYYRPAQMEDPLVL